MRLSSGFLSGLTVFFLQLSRLFTRLSPGFLSGLMVFFLRLLKIDLFGWSNDKNNFRSCPIFVISDCFERI
jgi:hypothetical protein